MGAKTIDTLVMEDGTLKLIDSTYNLDESNHVAELNHDDLLTYVSNYHSSPYHTVPTIQASMEYLKQHDFITL